MKTLTFEEYRELTPRTLPRLDHHTSEYRLLDNLHMVIGLATEVGELVENNTFELDSINKGEELGDVCWYLSNYINMNLTNKFYFASSDVWIDQDMLVEYNGLAINKKIKNPLTVLHIISNNLLDLHKKELAYGPKKLITKEEREYVVTNLFAAVNNCFYQWGLNPGEWLYKNIAKLITRYPDKFDSTNAVVRDLQKELNILKA